MALVLSPEGAIDEQTEAASPAESERLDELLRVMRADLRPLRSMKTRVEMEADTAHILHDLGIDTICSAMIQGRGPLAICSELEIEPLALFKWITSDEQRLNKYTQATRLQAAGLRERALMTVMMADENSPSAIGKAKVLSDVMLRVAKHFDPQPMQTSTQTTRVLHQHFNPREKVNRAIEYLEKKDGIVEEEDFHAVSNAARVNSPPEE